MVDIFTDRAKALGLTIITVAVVGAISYNQYQTDKQVAKLSVVSPIVEKVVVVVTPTIVPTATPAATRIFTPAKVSNTVTKGIK